MASLGLEKELCSAYLSIRHLGSTLTENDQQQVDIKIIWHKAQRKYFRYSAWRGDVPNLQVESQWQ